MSKPGNSGVSIGGLADTLRSFGYRGRMTLAHAVGDERYVFELMDPSRLDHRSMPGEEIHRFTRLAGILPNLFEQIKATSGVDASRMSALFDMDFLLYVVTADGVFGSMGWGPPGRAMPWITPILPEDRVLCQGYTSPAVPGRGLYGRQVTAVYLDGLAEDGGTGRMFTNCHIRNSASIRLFLGSGTFRSWHASGRSCRAGRSDVSERHPGPLRLIREAARRAEGPRRGQDPRLWVNWLAIEWPSTSEQSMGRDRCTRMVFQASRIFQARTRLFDPVLPANP